MSAPRPDHALVPVVAGGVPLALWLGYWRFWQYYHRYTVEGLEHLDGGPALIVGYHARPLAYDMCMLTVAIYDRLGYLPHGFVHRGTKLIGALRWFTEGLGFVTDDGDGLAAAITRGEHLVTTPGGGDEGCRDFRQRYVVNWGAHTGYLRLALKYRLPIIPGRRRRRRRHLHRPRRRRRRGSAARHPASLGVGALDGHRAARPLPVLAAVSGAAAPAGRRADRSRRRGRPAGPRRS